MKYTEEMDVGLSSAPLTNGDILPEPESLKRGSPSKSHGSNGLNGIKYHTSKVTNGILGHGSPTDKDIEEIGFEVESYSDFNTPIAPESHSENRYDSDKIDGSECTSGFKPRVENNIVKETPESDKSRSDSELVHDSSHLSEEFQLRLSDDDDSNLELTHNRNLNFYPHNAVSSTTEDVITRRSSSGAAFPKKDGDILSGSGILEGVSLKAFSQNEQEPNDSIKEDCHQVKSNKTPELGDKDSEEYLKEKSVKEFCEAKVNCNKADSLASQCNKIDSEEAIGKKFSEVSTGENLINKTSDDDKSCEKNTEEKCSSGDIEESLISSQQPACDIKIEKKEEPGQEEKVKHFELKFDNDENFHNSSGVGNTSLCVKSEIEIKNDFSEKLQIKQENGVDNTVMKCEVTEESFIKVENVCDKVETEIENGSLLKINESSNDCQDQSSHKEQLPKDNYSSLECEIEALENEIDGEGKDLNLRTDTSVQKDSINEFSSEETKASSTVQMDKIVTVQCKIGQNKNEPENKDALTSPEVSEGDLASPSCDTFHDLANDCKTSGKGGEEADSNKNLCTAVDGEVSLTQHSKFPNDQIASEDEECFSSESTNRNDHTLDVDVPVMLESSKKPLASCDSLEIAPFLCNENNTKDNNETECKLDSVLLEGMNEKSPDSEPKADLALEDSNDSNIAVDESNTDNPLEDDFVCEDNDILDGVEQDAENLDKSDKESTATSDTDQIFTTELVESSPSLSPTFCESTLLDASSADEMESQDCSSNVNESNISKGHSSELLSRKRTLSNSDNDSCDSLKNKRLSGLSGSKERQDSSNSLMKTHIDSTHKRPAESNVDSDAKKLRFGNERKKSDCDNVSNSKDTENIDTQSEEIERLCKLQKAASIQGAPISGALHEQESFLDLATERLVDKAATASASSQSMDLPFLRKLHKKKLSRMSRSDLEELVVQKICEAITERSLVGELRRRCQTLEKGQERDKERFNSLRKQMTELNIVMKKYLDNQKNHVPQPPLKVTRSVGLQVCQAIKPLDPRPIVRTTRPPYNYNQTSKISPVAKTASTTPSRQGQEASSSYTPQKSSQASSTTSTTPPTPSSRTPPVLSPQFSRPAATVVSSSDPPALVPTSTPTTPTSVPETRTVVGVSRQAITSPQMKIPPLQQISGLRPRFSTPITVASSTSQIVHILQNKQTSPPNSNSKTPGNGDVEVIDIIDKDEQNKRPAPGIRIPIQQQQHQQKQAANAAAQNLAGNTGMTVRLISPSQVSQPGMTIASGYPQLLVPSQNLPQRMILTSASQGNPIRGNYKLVMKANQIIPLQSTHGGTVSSSVVQLPSSAQAAVQQIFTNANTGTRTSTIATVRQIQSVNIHPAPLPCGPTNQASNPMWKQLPPRPNLKIQHQNNGIVLSWNMALGPSYADIESYQLYAYQEGTAPPSANLWKKVGDVKALPLPMACTLTQFVEGHRYHFTVRAVDKHGRLGPFSQQGSIRLGN